MCRGNFPHKDLIEGDDGVAAGGRDVLVHVHRVWLQQQVRRGPGT